MMIKEGGVMNATVTQNATYETMVEAGIICESAYYESLHESPLISNLIARKKLYEMNVVISDTAEYGCYLFDNLARPLLAEKLMPSITKVDIGEGITGDTAVDNVKLVLVNAAIRNHEVEEVGQELRAHMTDMKSLI